VQGFLSLLRQQAVQAPQWRAQVFQPLPRQQMVQVQEQAVRARQVQSEAGLQPLLSQQQGALRARWELPWE
jgi:CYTH domain-containing protein